MRRPVAQAVGLASEARGFAAGRGQQHGVEAFVIHAPGVAIGLQRFDARAQAQVMAARLQPGGRGRGKQLAQIAGGQQKVRAAAAAEQRVAQHAQEHRAARLRGRRVERGNAQRLDELGH
ncbi:hypothetical protein D3C78_1689010 [compost metagenome]